MDERAQRQVDLLLRLLPIVAREHCFALKGGTAINLFVRDLPRLSVDIDLVYLPIDNREQSLAGIDAAMRRIAARASSAREQRRQVGLGILRPEGVATKLFVRDPATKTQVKVETTPVMRGCVYEPKVMELSGAVAERLGFASINVASFPDLYAGKIVAALDRQHPRDLFDVHHLLANEGIGDALRTAFVIYLLSHGRSLYALLSPKHRDLTLEFERGLAHLVNVPVTVAALVETRDALVADLVERMPDRHKRFLLSFELGEPDWGLLDVHHAKNLPAVRWRVLKNRRLDAEERESLVSRLEAALKLSAWQGGSGAGGTPPGGPSGGSPNKKTSGGGRSAQAEERKESSTAPPTGSSPTLADAR